jgi:hypothetical protein
VCPCLNPWNGAQHSALHAALRAARLEEHDAGAGTWRTLTSYAAGLRSLALQGCDARDLQQLSALPHLTQLSLLRCDVHGLEGLPPTLRDLTLSSLSGATLEVRCSVQGLAWCESEAAPSLALMHARALACMLDMGCECTVIVHVMPPAHSVGIGVRARRRLPWLL